MSRKVQRTLSGDRFGILNPYGDLWTEKTFATAAAARKSVEDFWPERDKEYHDRFRVVPVVISVVVALDPQAED